MFLKIGFTIFSSLFLSCGVNQNLSQTEEINKNAEIEVQKMEGEKMISEGYLPGRVVYSDLADDCEYTIQLEDSEKNFYYVDPMNLAEDFMKDERTVWVKFDGLRRMNRCEKANPVMIVEIKDRKE